MKPRLSLVTLGVRDLGKSLAFYREGLGFTPLPDGNEHVAFFQLGAMRLSLFGRAALAEDAHVRAGEGFGNFSLAQNYDSKAEVDAAYEKALAAGATSLKKPEDVFWGGYSGYVADPDGFAWELAWNPHWNLDADGHVR